MIDKRLRARWKFLVLIASTHTFDSSDNISPGCVAAAVNRQNTKKDEDGDNETLEGVYMLATRWHC